MMEITFGKSPNHPDTLDFVNNWNVDIVLNDTLD